MQRNNMHVKNIVSDVKREARSKLNSFPFLLPDDTKAIPTTFRIRPIVPMSNVATPLIAKSNFVKDVWSWSDVLKDVL